jgi:hypothetical protein
MDSNPPGPSDARRFATATQRNREPILTVLREELPASGLVLEVASGTGEHALAFAAALPGLVWQPSDPSPEACASIAAWREGGPANLLTPLALDAASPYWPVDRADAVLCINMVHISPWAATEGLMRGAGKVLPAKAPLIVYGPFRRAGRPLEPSNAAFDADLRARDPAWGLRAVEDVADCAAANGLKLARVAEMPANNLTLVLRRG